MPALSVIKNPPELDQMSALLQRRDAHGAELERLRWFDVMVAQAQARLDQADADQAALGAQEQASLREWVANGAHGSAPVMEHAARQAIEQRRGLALGDLAAAIRQQEAVQGRVAEINAALRSLGSEIYAAKLENLLSELPEIEKAMVDAMRGLDANQLKLKGLAAALDAEQGEAFARGDEARAAALRGALVRVQSLKEPKIEQTYGDILASGESWRARLR